MNSPYFELFGAIENDEGFDVSFSVSDSAWRDLGPCPKTLHLPKCREKNPTTHHPHDAVHAAGA